MKHRQNRRASVQHRLAVRLLYRPLDFQLVFIGLRSPVGPGRLFVQIRLTAGGIRADIRRVPVVPACPELVQSIRTGRRCLSLQRFQLERRRHLRPDHAHQIRPQIQLQHPLAVQYLQLGISIQRPAFKRRQTRLFFLRSLRRLLFAALQRP